MGSETRIIHFCDRCQAEGPVVAWITQGLTADLCGDCEGGALTVKELLATIVEISRRSDIARTAPVRVRGEARLSEQFKAVLPTKNNYPCPIPGCVKVGNSMGTMDHHLRSTHGMVGKLSDYVGLDCPLCPHVLPSDHGSQAFSRHIVVAHGGTVLSAFYHATRKDVALAMVGRLMAKKSMNPVMSTPKRIHDRSHRGVAMAVRQYVAGYGQMLDGLIVVDAIKAMTFLVDQGYSVRSIRNARTWLKVRSVTTAGKAPIWTLDPQLAASWSDVNFTTPPHN
jgi:hypothetical protein